MEQGSSTIWWIIGIVVVALGLWYYYGMRAPTPVTETSSVAQTQIPALTGGDTTADISADLGQIPDTSAALDADAAATAEAVSGL